MVRDLNKLRQLIGKNIKKYRLIAGFSKAELARRACISYSHYCAIENCKANNPKLDTLCDITDALGIEHFLIWEE